MKQRFGYNVGVVTLPISHHNLSVQLNVNNADPCVAQLEF